MDPLVARYAEVMDEELQADTCPYNWNEEGPRSLLEYLKDKVRELEELVVLWEQEDVTDCPLFRGIPGFLDEVQSEAAGIGNMAARVAESMGALEREERTE